MNTIPARLCELCGEHKANRVTIDHQGNACDAAGSAPGHDPDPAHFILRESVSVCGDRISGSLA